MLALPALLLVVVHGGVENKVQIFSTPSIKECILGKLNYFKL
jgi:hypothetical protein